MKMASDPGPEPPTRGLLLCVLALHICIRDPFVTAEHNAVTNSAPVAISKASVATAAAANTTWLATATTINAASVATSSASVSTAATINTSFVAANTTNTASMAIAVPPPSASGAPPSSVNGTEEPALTCQSFQCSGERCYQDEAHANRTVTCRNEPYCELYRLSGTTYAARCSSVCSTELCRARSSGSTQPCALDCCASPLCLQLNASAYGDLPPTTVLPVTTTTTTTMPQALPQNGKVCAAFSCHGDGCFKGKKAVARCIVGHDFCEMKKTGLSYMAGCSKACKAARPTCAGGMRAACYQECCPATPRGSCLKLDGKVHVNSAGQVPPALLLELMVFGVLLLLN